MLLMLAIAANISYAFQTNSSNYKQNLIVSSGGEISNSSNYKNYIATGLVAGIINSSAYKNWLGFFYGWKLADDQPCTTDDQCEGGYCCSSLCRSSSCPVEEPPSEGGAAAAAGGGGGGFVPSVDFSVKPGSIKVKLVLGMADEEVLTIKNTGRIDLKISLNVEGVQDYLFLSGSGFDLKPNEVTEVTLNFIGKDVGNFVGQIIVSADEIQKSIPIIIDVMSEIILFDVKLDIPDPEVYPGEKLDAQISILNVGEPEKVDVFVTYLIKDLTGSVIYEETETFAVEEQISYPKSFEIDENTIPADYVLVAEVVYADSFAVSSQIFKVLERKPTIALDAATKNMTLLYLLLILLLILLLLLFLFRRKKKRSRNYIICHNLLLKANDALKRNDRKEAKNLYRKAKEVYAKLDYEEKKEIYSEFLKVYNKSRSRQS